MTDAASRVADLAAAIAAHRFHFTDEAELQEGLARVLTESQVPFEREVRLSPTDRIDFLAYDGIGIEVKVGGGVDAAMRQMQRYAEHERIGALVLVTNSARGARVDVLEGKPLRVIRLLGGIL